MENRLSNLFCDRLKYLMREHGFDPDKHGSNKALASAMYNKGCLGFYVDSRPEQALANTSRRINEHINKTDSASSVSGQWLKAYCDYFGCSADFLFGYIDSPTHNECDITTVTGLSGKAIRNLSHYNRPNCNYIFYLNQLLENSDTYMRLLQAIERYANEKDIQAEKERLEKMLGTPGAHRTSELVKVGNVEIASYSVKNALERILDKVKTPL